jgi:dihydropteroate synthase
MPRSSTTSPAFNGIQRCPKPALISAAASSSCTLEAAPANGAPNPASLKEEVIPLVRSGLAQSLEIATHAGIDRNRVVLDPGYGFGKTYDNNYPLLAHLDELLTLGQPLLAGVSRKSFLARTLSEAHRLQQL